MNSDYNESPVNLGNPSEITILHLTEKLRKITGRNNPVKFETLPQDDPVRRCPDINLARRVLSWEPKTPLDEGLIRVIDYFRSKLETN